tara:strand:+ start:255106 stop:255306 length:201 start_codon:yes stop_codon:yes gene_type:complete
MKLLHKERRAFAPLACVGHLNWLRQISLHELNIGLRSFKHLPPRLRGKQVASIENSANPEQSKTEL